MSTATATNPWKMKTSSNEGGDFELPSADTYPAALVALIDMGTHEQEFSGKKSDVHKVYLVWELLTENDSKGQPFRVAKEFTLSLNVKAKLRAFLAGWEGRQFGDNEEIDLLSFVGRTCMVNVTEGLSGSGKRFVDVSSCTKLVKGITVDPPSVEPFVFAINDTLDPKTDPPVPDWVPMTYGKKVVDMIKTSREWCALAPF